ncbi:hypothetical protein PI124_g18664 [Phytophthora idaei]|nr:hypothetical protein PI124_g18664 [Phytophthora idaei]
MQHVRREHPDYEAVMLTASTAETDSLLNYERRSALNVFGWLDLIIKNGLPLHFCENPAARRYSHLDPICVETLQRAMESLTRIFPALSPASRRSSNRVRTSPTHGAFRWA